MVVLAPSPRVSERITVMAEARGIAQLAQRIPHVGPDGFQRRPLPHFAASLFDDRAIPKRAAGGLLGILPVHSLAHQLLGALFKMQAHLFGKIVINGAAAEDVS